MLAGCDTAVRRDHNAASIGHAVIDPQLVDRSAAELRLEPGGRNCRAQVPDGLNQIRIVRVSIGLEQARKVKSDIFLVRDRCFEILQKQRNGADILFIHVAANRHLNAGFCHPINRLYDRVILIQVLPISLARHIIRFRAVH